MAGALKQHDAVTLDSGYTAGHRIAEWCGTIVATGFFVWLGVTVARCPPLSGWWMPLAALVGILASDFTSGFVHWLFDTWGGLETPVLGRLAIRTFREHHVDAKAITRHGFIQTNAQNIALTVIWTGIGLAIVRPATATLADVFLGQALLCASVFTASTSQIHKWAHMDRPPRVVALLQRARLLLGAEHHAVHHAPPYHRNYCITVGWMNGPLRAIRFFETLERTIAALTGLVPREDDIGTEAAIEVATELGVVETVAADDADEANVT